MDPVITAHTLFKRQFGHPPVHEVRVPVGLVLLGHAAPQTQGIVLAAAIDKYFHLALAPRSDGKIELICNAPANRESFWVSNLASNPRTPWADVPKSVLDQLRRRGVPFSGFNAAIRSDSVHEVLESRSAPAALALATAFGVRMLHPFSLTETGLARPPQRDSQGRIPEPGLAERLHLATLCSRALPSHPDSFVQAAAAGCAKAWHVLTLDLRDRTAEHLPLVGEIPALSFPEKDSGQACDIIGRLLPGAARKLGLKSWRSVEPQFLDSVKEKLPMKTFAAARAAVNDHFLAVAAERVLRSDDHALFGEYLQRSEENWRVVTGPLSRRQRIVVEIAKAHPASLATVALPQFPGAVLHLLRHHLAPHLEQHLTSHFKALTGENLQTVFCQPVDGAA